MPVTDTIFSPSLRQSNSVHVSTKLKHDIIGQLMCGDPEPKQCTCNYECPAYCIGVVIMDSENNPSMVALRRVYK